MRRMASAPAAPSAGLKIRDVSDTALFVATHRAMETERPDAIFRDPYARRLAGERGEQITRMLRSGSRMAWSTITRTVLFDEVITRLVRDGGADMVVNLAAGLDSRPYRMDLPAALLWVEVDLPGMIEYKESQLRKDEAEPRCRLERIALNLGDDTARRALFARLNGEADRVVVMSEGLLIYLKPEVVAALATDLHAQPHFRWWTAEIAAPKVRDRMQKYWGKQFDAANASLHFAPAEGSQFFAPMGWREAEFHELFETSLKINRPMPGAWVMKLMFKLAPGRAAAAKKEWRSGVMVLDRA